MEKKEQNYSGIYFRLSLSILPLFVPLSRLIIQAHMARPCRRTSGAPDLVHSKLSELSYLEPHLPPSSSFTLLASFLTPGHEPAP